MSDAIGEGQRFGDAYQRLFRIPQQPFGRTTYISGAHTRIVSTKNKPMGTVIFRIIEPPSLVGVPASVRRFADHNRRRPPTVMRLKTQARVRLPLGQPQQPLRVRTSGRYSARHGVALPHAIERFEPLLRISLHIGKLVCSCISREGSDGALRGK